MEINVHDASETATQILIRTQFMIQISYFNEHVLVHSFATFFVYLIECLATSYYAQPLRWYLESIK